MNNPTRLETDKPVSVPAISRFVSISMRLGNNNVTHFVLFDKWGKP